MRLIWLILFALPAVLDSFLSQVSHHFQKAYLRETRVAGGCTQPEGWPFSDGRIR